MSARRGRRRHEEEEEHGPDERWMASYMDMVTVLMCMFIVLFAMSTVDQNKFEELRNSLATGFGVTNIGKVDTAQGTVVPPDKADAKSQSFADGQAAVTEVENLRALQEKISTALSAHGLAGTVQFQLDERGLTIRLVDSQTFFTPNSTALVGVATSVLDTVAPILAGTTYGISVEGHADLRQPQSPYPTNWELSSGRAVQVLRRMVEVGGIAPERIGAVGYGSSRPLADGTSQEALAQNRRVDIVVLSNAPESVRALIPDVIKGEITDKTTTANKIAPFLLPASALSR
ncbi:flagellar motor protein MotB [Glaciihabitans sp. UYNi722]|uniref:OmpA/MotB family protein n=1 Tax=Glaciihabitans sp. UYNi722 TaxID=3156344 RepID=UPI003394E716